MLKRKQEKKEKCQLTQLIWGNLNRPILVSQQLSEI